MRWIVLPSFAGTDDALTDEAFLEEELTGDKIVLEDDLKEFADEIDHATENSSSG